MKKINELKEIAEFNLDTELSSKESAIVKYFQGHPEFLSDAFPHFSVQEKLSIIRFFDKSEKIEAELDLRDDSFIFNQPELNQILKQEKIHNYIQPEILERLKNNELFILDVELIDKHDGLGFFKNYSKPETPFISQKLNSILEKATPQVKGIAKNVALVSSLMLGTAMFSSCGADGITAKVNYQLPKAPITLPAIDQISGDFQLNFANHAVHANEDDELTAYSMAEEMLIEVPKTINQVSFLSDRVKPTLTLTLNNQYVCSYIWVEAGQSNPNVLDGSVASVGEYRMHRSCYLEMQTQVGMVLKVQNIPKAKTVTLKFNFEK